MGKCIVCIVIAIFTIFFLHTRMGEDCVFVENYTDPTFQGVV